MYKDVYMDADYYIKQLGLKPLIKNDYLKEIYISEKGYSSWAYYLLRERDIFPFHKILSDGSWQYCAGGPLNLIIINKDNELETITIGADLNKNQRFLHVVAPNEWFAATPTIGSEFTLISHCIAPQYKYSEDFCGYYEEIAELIPEDLDIAKRFCCLRGENDEYIFNSEFGYR